MGIVSELFDGIAKFKFWTTINEYQNGLFYNKGVVIPLKISDSKLDELLQTEWDRILEEKIERKEENTDKLIVNRNMPRNIQHLESLEERAYKDFLKYNYTKINNNSNYNSKDYYDFENNNMEKYVVDKSGSFLEKSFVKNKLKFDPSFSKDYSGWKVSSYGNPIHPTRFRKNLPHGIYLHLPPILDIQSVYEVSVMETVKNVELVTVLSTDNFNKYKSVSIETMLRYKIEDAYKACNKVSLWESSYQSHALVEISNYCKQKTLNDFYSKDFNNGLIKHLKKELNNMPRKDWGIRTMEVGLSTVAITEVKRNMQEFETEGINLKITNDLTEKSA